MDQIRKYYDQFARQYSESRADGLSLNPLPYLKFFPRLLPGTHLVDLGCGPGFESELAGKYGLSVTGVDVSPQMIDLFKERNPSAASVVAEIWNTGAQTNTFDAFLSSFSLVHCSNKELAESLGEIARIVKPSAEGLILVGCVESRLEVNQIHREAKEIAGIQPVPFYFRSVSDWQKYFEAAGLLVAKIEQYPVASSPISVTGFFVKMRPSKSHITSS